MKYSLLASEMKEIESTITTINMTPYLIKNHMAFQLLYMLSSLQFNFRAFTGTAQSLILFSCSKWQSSSSRLKNPKGEIILSPEIWNYSGAVASNASISNLPISDRVSPPQHNQEIKKQSNKQQKKKKNLIHWCLFLIDLNPYFGVYKCWE